MVVNGCLFPRVVIFTNTFLLKDWQRIIIIPSLGSWKDQTFICIHLNSTNGSQSRYDVPAEMEKDIGKNNKKIFNGFTVICGGYIFRQI